jgi:hypothetical protein
MWRELRQLVKIGEQLEQEDKLPPRGPEFKELVNSIRDDHPPNREHGWNGLKMREAKLAAAAMGHLAGIVEEDDRQKALEGGPVGGAPPPQPQLPPGGDGTVTDGVITLRCPPNAQAGTLLKVKVTGGEVMSVVVPKDCKPGELFTLTDEERVRTTQAYHDDMRRIMHKRRTNAPSRTTARWDPEAAAAGKTGGASLEPEQVLRKQTRIFCAISY